MVLYERSGEDIDRGLVGYWKLDDKKSGSSVAIDRANFNDGTITGCTNATGINGLNPDAMSFNGTTDEIALSATIGDILPSLNMGTSDFSISVIAKIDTGAAEKNEIFTCRDLVPGTGNFGAGHDFENGYYFSYGDAGFIYEGNTKFDKLLSIVYTINGQNVKIYLNGVLSKDATMTGTVTTDKTITPKIGETKTFNAKWDGTLQNLRIYNRVLTDGEISKLYRLKL